MAEKEALTVWEELAFWLLGLECGILCTALGRDTDCISIGPEINEIHTPREWMSLSGFAGCYRLLSALIKE